MKKIKYFVFLLGILVLEMPIVKAECSIEEENRLSSLAYKVKANFDVITKELPLGDGMAPPDGLTQEEIDNFKYEKRYFKIYITNITDELYVTVKNDKDKTSKIYTYKDATDNVISFEEEVTWDIVNYTIDVYASSGDCNKKLNTISLKTPMYNKYSEYAVCDDIKEYYLCKEYITNETSFDNFFEKVEEYKQSKNKNEEKTEEENEGFTNFVKNHKGIIIITSIIVIVTGGVVTVIIVKKQRSKK